jgi:hypothetical protein
MKKLLMLLSTLLMLVSNIVLAQNCPSSPTYKNQDGTYDLTAGRSLVVNDGKSHNITIQNDFSSTSTICVTNGSTVNLSFNAVNFPEANGSIYVDATSKLTLTGTAISNFPLTLTNYGTLTQNIDVTFTNGAIINNYRTYNTTSSFIVNSGTIVLNNSGTMNLSGQIEFNSSSFKLNNLANGVLTIKNNTELNSGQITNNGTINFNGTTAMSNSVEFENSGYIYFIHTVILNRGSIINYGLIDANENITLNKGVSITNYCTITGDKALTINSADIINYGSILLKVNGTADNSFTNQGNFVNGPNGFVQGSDFTNNSNITGGGNFYFTRNTSNNGIFSGTSSSNINFYDASNTTSKFFDVQNSSPQYTTKNAIIPLATTTLTSCGYPAPPVITTQPATVNLCDNTTKTATFSVSATSPYSSMTYQWRKNGVNISGATASSYTANNLTLADTANTYTVAVTNDKGTTVCNAAYINYIIVTQPSNITVATGSPFTFTVKASDIATAFQWTKKGANIAGATYATYTDASAALTDSGSYAVKVSYNGGSCVSNSAILTVENPPAITTQPQAQVLCDSTTKSVAFSVTAATSKSTLSYQWYKNGTAITGATASSYTATGLRYADTSNNYYVVLKNGIGSTTSSIAGFKYVILTQPSNLYAPTGTPASFTVKASDLATTFQWTKNGANIGGATFPTYTDASAALSDSGSYAVKVNYKGGSCISNSSILTVEAPPTIITQPQVVQLCDSTSTSATFSVVASSPKSAITYQWYKNGAAITGATSSNYTATYLKTADTANAYSVVLTNTAGTSTSNATGFKYVIIAHPTSTTVATGNVGAFTVKTSGATAIQWYKNGTNIDKAKSFTYNTPVVTVADSASYLALLTYSSGTCISKAAKLFPSVVLYSKSTGSMNAAATWGVDTDGSGSTPVDFTRDEHTFVVSNRDTITATTNLTIAGKLDLNDSKLIIAPKAMLTAGRIVRSGKKGMIAGASTSSIKLTGITNTVTAGASDLYFDPTNNTIGGLYTAGHTVNLHNALNLTAGTIAGILQVNSGTFNTSDSLTLKSDSSGSAFVYKSNGVINGKVMVEKYIPARRAYRFIGSPVSAIDAPTINAAWQEGTTSSTDNPHPGYGTHITYGAVADGYDQNPQKTFSMFVLRNGSWTGVPPTKTTKVTDYPAYMMFIRGDRSYNITSTTSTTAPKSTILRTMGSLRQGTQANVTVGATGFTLVSNPFACPIDFDVVAHNSKNIKATARIWDPTLAGTKGVGAYVTVDWTSTGYITTPPSDVKNILPTGQGFWVQSADGKNSGTLNFDETDKYLPGVYSKSYNTFRQSTNRESQQEAMLEVDLKVFNDDSTTGIADGVLYHFSSDYSNDVDGNDITKLSNIYENLSIINSNTLLTVERRQAPTSNDTLHLNLTGSKSTNYMLEFVPKNFSNIIIGNLYLYDRYLNTRTQLSNTDTSRVTININTAIAGSKDANRFSIVSQQVLLPVTFSSARAYAKGKTAQVEWNVANEIDVQYYEIEKSANGTTFTKAGRVQATGVTSYNFNDANPFDGSSYYRVKSVDKSGKTTYTKVMPVTIDNIATSSLAVYPNPLKGKTFQVQISNKAAGTYTLQLISNSGQQLYTQTISYNGGIATYNVQLNNNLASGIYFIKAVAVDGSSDVIKVIVQ